MRVRLDKSPRTTRSIAINRLSFSNPKRTRISSLDNFSERDTLLSPLKQSRYTHLVKIGLSRPSVSTSTGRIRADEDKVPSGLEVKNRVIHQNDTPAL